MITEETDNILFKSFHSDKLPRPDQNDDSFENDEDTNCSDTSEKNDFSCSTPLMTHEEEQRNSNLSISNSSGSPAKETVGKEDMLNQRKGNGFSQSLAEFEEYEQMLVDSSNRNQRDISLQNDSFNISQSTAYKSLLNGPINQMENLLSDLRSNYNQKTNPQQPKNQTAFNSAEEHLFKPTIQLESEPMNNSYNFNAMANKILPITAQVFTATTNHRTTEPVETNINTNNNTNLINPNAFNSNYLRKGDQLIALENRLENETLRRQHCEKQIYELNEHLLEVQQQLAIANCLDKKRDMFVQNMDSSLQKILNNWKQKEVQIERDLTTAKSNKQESKLVEQKHKMRIQLLEQELNQTNDNLVSEKVKTQEMQNEMTTLKNALNDAMQSFIDRTNEVERKTEEVENFKSKSTIVNQEIENLKKEIINLRDESKGTEQRYSSENETLLNKNKFLNEKNEKIKIDYENLVKEAKYMISESEKQYNELLKTIETEKMTKDSLQLDINVLEEKLANTVKMLTNDYANKINKIQEFALEKEKSQLEEHKTEFEQIKVKSKIEFDKLKKKHFDELHNTTKDYETKLTELNLALDTHRNEIDRLKRANTDIENDRNQIRHSLKQMLELQMKEAMQLLGVNKTNIDANLESINSITAKKASEPPAIENLDPSLAMLSYENSINQLFNKFQITQNKQVESEPKINNTNQIQTLTESSKLNHSFGPEVKESIANSSNFSKEITFDMQNLHFKPNETTQSSTMPHNPLYSSSVKDLTTSQLNSKPLHSTSTVSVKDTTIKDSYILNQIEMINKFYQVDNTSTCPKPDSTHHRKLNKSLASSASVSNNSSFNSEHNNNSINLLKPKEQSQTPTSQISSLKTPEKSIPPQPTPLIPSKKLTHRLHILENEILDKSADETCNNTATTHRANDLRNFIEKLLVRSPAKEDVTPRNSNESISKLAPSGNKSFGNHSESGQLASNKSLVRFNYTAYSNEHEDATDIYNSSLEEEDQDDLQSKSKYYSHHDISDIDLGYTKRQSTAYYDDVKRTLNFDDDTENPSEDESEAPVLNQDKFMFNNSTSTPTKSRNSMLKSISSKNVSNINKKNIKAPQRNTSGPQNTSTNNKIRVLKKVKAQSKANTSMSNLSSSRSHSMISLATSCSSAAPQNKVLEITKESKGTRNAKQRVWK